MKSLDPTFLRLLVICTVVYKKARELIPYSANKPNLEYAAPHRQLVLNIVRGRNPLLPKYKELISRLNLFIGNDKVSRDFYDKELIGSFDGLTNPSMRQIITKVKSIERLEKIQHKDGTPFEFMHAIERSAKRAIQFGLGNCAELARLTYTLLLEYDTSLLKQKITVELMSCATGDHAYVVVNRKPDSQINDLTTWGEKALIIDSWDGDIMHATTGKSALDSNNKRYYDYYEYIKSHEPSIENSGCLGQGLSSRFYKHATEKNRPHRFFHWKAKYTGNKKQDKKRELKHIPMDIEVKYNKRKPVDVEEVDLPCKKRRLS